MRKKSRDNRLGEEMAVADSRSFFWLKSFFGCKMNL